MINFWQNRVAIVTGGGSGIGQAAAFAFARRGVQVAVVDRDPKGGEATTRDIQAAGGKAIFLQTDVASEAAVERMVAATLERFERLDFAFNNAGVDQPSRELVDYSENDWNHILGVNLKGIWLCMKHQIPHLLERGGSIVNTASVLGFRGSRKMGPYVASKHGVIGLSKAAALEYAPYGVRVNALCPGSIETPMFLNFVGHDSQRMARNLQGIPLGRRGTPQEIAEIAVWLCSEESAFVTGCSLVADGGATV
jgi:NAD(P)-dependent dehydrogenase (short-subunit alcohol dehydrogenase family)